MHEQVQQPESLRLAFGQGCVAWRPSLLPICTGVQQQPCQPVLCGPSRPTADEPGSARSLCLQCDRLLPATGDGNRHGDSMWTGEAVWFCGMLMHCHCLLPIAQAEMSRFPLFYLETYSLLLFADGRLATQGALKSGAHCCRPMAPGTIRCWGRSCSGHCSSAPCFLL